ncbi:GNAT family N-acetyltransferase [Gilvimarinus polysaccharolyticus]|uniref:GNAT family N-acetyltransferase n=1 Tax=Gilvimarinus polysaccharolyticus TaxID=863921 RepID=UPI0006739FAE|nr:GNAT family N-acetyltransferase [Gilvimarinus polysaccharolyticus]
MAKFGAIERLQNSYIDGTNTFSRPGEGLFVVRLGSKLVGICGLNIDPYQESAEVGRLRHLYVAETHRLKGVGRKLVSEVEVHAQGTFDSLQLYTSDPKSSAFYLALGYKKGGIGKASHAKQLQT